MTEWVINVVEVDENNDSKDAIREQESNHSFDQLPENFTLVLVLNVVI